MSLIERAIKRMDQTPVPALHPVALPVSDVAMPIEPTLHEPTLHEPILREPMPHDPILRSPVVAPVLDDEWSSPSIALYSCA